MSDKRHARTLLLLCCCLWLVGRTALADDEEEDFSSADGGNKREYSSPAERQKALEHMVSDRKKDTGLELKNQPIYTEPGAVASSEPALVPGRSKPGRNQAKKYGFPTETGAQATENLQTIPVAEQGELETELQTKPLTSADTTSSQAGQEVCTVSASLNRPRIHLDESFTLTLQAVVLDLSRLAPFRLPAMPDFNLINESQNEVSSTSSGQVTWVRTREYVFVARSPGQFVVPEISINYGGKKFLTQSLSLEVGGSRSGLHYARRGSGKPGEYVPGAPDIGANKKEAMEISAEVQPEHLFANQQAILVVHLKYVGDDQTTVSYRPPHLAGFLTEELPESKTEERVSAANQNFIEKQYRTALFPIQPGSLPIPPAEVILTKKQQSQSFASDPLTLDVRPLPADEEAKHTGGKSALVGKYALAAQWDSARTAEDQPLRLTLVLSGQGNVRGAPEPSWNGNGSCRSYLENEQEHIAVRAGGVQGEHRYAYLVVFTRPGKIRLGEASLRYFDPDSKRWRWARAQIPEVQVVARQDPLVAAAPKEQPGQTLNLRARHRGHMTLQPITPWAMARWLFWLLQLAGPVWLAAAWLFRQHQARLLKDADLIRIRKAFALAKKALRYMRRCLQRREDKQFYDGLAKVATDYLAAKFEVPNAYIGIEKLPEYFERFEVPAVLQQRFKAVLTACEYVRYAAVVLPDKDRWALFHDMQSAIQQFEHFWVQRSHWLKKSRLPAALLLLGLLAAAWPVFAGEAEVHFWRANGLAEKGDYRGAETEYAQVIRLQIEDPDVYYNLGNTYAQAGNLGQAVLAYKRGLRLAPRSSDLRYNLRQTELWVLKQSPTPMNLPPENKLMTLYQSLTPNEAAWGAAVFSLLAFLAGGLLLLKSKQGKIKAALWLTASLAIGLALWSCSRQFESSWHKEAVVMTGPAEIFSRPYANAEKLFTWPAGTCVLAGSEEEAWVEVYGSQGQHGWAKRSTLGFVE